MFEHLQTIKNDFVWERSQFLETHIMLERGDGFIQQLPELKNFEAGRKLLEVENALGFGNYQHAFELTEQANTDQDLNWFWSLARLHATWRLGLDTQQALIQFNQTQTTMLKSSLQTQYLIFINQVLKPEILSSQRASLKLQAESQFQTIIGIFAGDAALYLESISNQ